MPRRVCVVGAGSRFLSGISYYTRHLAHALAERNDVSVVLMRQLLPTSLYPGRDRVGAPLSELSYDPAVRVFDGVDWYWLPSLARATAFLRRERPEVLVLQWWTGTVLHSYLALATAARQLGARIVIEFHEVLDPGEASLSAARTYVRTIAPTLVRLGSGFVVHSEVDRVALRSCYPLGQRPTEVIPLGPFDAYQQLGTTVERQAPADVCNLLYFGVIRPYKGLEDLVEAFDGLPPDQIDRYWLTVVGESWEGWTRPLELIERSRYRDRITLVNRYVPDQEVGAYFRGADAVVLPYHRSSASGPLHVTMSHGLPVVVTAVGGLVEAASGYAGAELVPPRDPDVLRQALLRLPARLGRYEDPHSWARTAERYERLFDALSAPVASARVA